MKPITEQARYYTERHNLKTEVSVQLRREFQRARNGSPLAMRDYIEEMLEEAYRAERFANWAALSGLIAIGAAIVFGVVFL